MMSQWTALYPQKSDPVRHPVVRVIIWIVKHWKLLIGLYALVYSISQTAGFTSFLIEEKSQQLGFGVFSYQQAKMYEEAHAAILWCIQDGKRDLKLYKILNWFNPFTGWVFVDYGKGNLKKLEWQLDAVSSRVTVVETKVEKLEERKTALPLAQISLQTTALRPVRVIDILNEKKPEKAVVASYYRTQFGAKYHRRTCGSIKGRDVSATDGRGLEACRRCKP